MSHFAHVTCQQHRLMSAVPPRPIISSRQPTQFAIDFFSTKLFAQKPQPTSYPKLFHACDWPRKCRSDALCHLVSSFKLKYEDFLLCKLSLEKRQATNWRSKLVPPNTKDSIPNQLLSHLRQQMSPLDNHTTKNLQNQSKDFPPICSAPRFLCKSSQTTNYKFSTKKNISSQILLHLLKRDVATG